MYVQAHLYYPMGSVLVDNQMFTFLTMTVFATNINVVGVEAPNLTWRFLMLCFGHS